MGSDPGPVICRNDRSCWEPTRESTAMTRPKSLVGGALVDLYSRLHENSPAQDTPPTPSSDDIERTLKDTFKRLDRDIMHGSVDAVLSNSAGGADADALAPAHSGSSALLSFYDSHSRTLHVALTGDSRAVLGRRTRNKDGDVVYQVQVMTVEQDGDNLAEEYRLNARHPGEAVVYNGRVVGGGPTRSFGDALYKWDSVTRGQLQQASIGKPTPSDVLTPPYLTAEPEVTSTTVQPGDFLIMGTRAMWDRLTSEEAVGLVGMWLDKGVREQGGRRRVKPAVSPNDCLATPLAVGIRSESYRSEDRNVAMHLLRNSMSGDIGTQADTTKNGLTATVVFFAED
ncbi:hypothetical protein EVJ58_g5398 [Rhodofomes roseus]|uniref:PPM-type phosphatase domain-containing protein n=1 Tax=Rhodofomes roseus TaxID=34475 RepID=A0A4Y9YCI1_9APHY|nr:hypothetical protein EVJ58_g5398 [Rhodofomes roseus]